KASMATRSMRGIVRRGRDGRNDNMPTDSAKAGKRCSLLQRGAVNVVHFLGYPLGATPLDEWRVVEFELIATVAMVSGRHRRRPQQPGARRDYRRIASPPKRSRDLRNASSLT